MRSWAPTAPARARSSRSSPALSAPTAARSRSAAGSASRTRPPRRAGAAWSPSTRSRPLIPDLDIRDNLRLTETPVEPFRHWMAELGLPDIDLSSLARRLPLASLRIIDLARALAIEPDVLMLDEMTAALPANLTERVLEVVGTPPRRLAVDHLHLAPHDRDRRRLRPGHGPPRGRDGRRRGRDRRLRGADRRAHARAARARPAPRRARRRRRGRRTRRAATLARGR